MKNSLAKNAFKLSMGILSILPRPNNWHSTEKLSKNGRMKEAEKGLGQTNAYYQA